MRMTTMPAIILAAGASRRLGQPKQLIRIAGETLLDRTLRMVCDSGAGPALVVLGAHQDTIQSIVDLAKARSIINPNWEQGIATSIHVGIHAAQELDATAALLLVCDQPRLTAEHLRELMVAHEKATGPTIVASAYAGILGIPAIFPASQFPHLLALQGDAGARHLLRNPNCALISVPFTGGEIDLDTLSDLAKLEADSGN
jgi:CTP:molybdopterin cytidylyltransferase MocA